jgi:hypothetical protein
MQEIAENEYVSELNAIGVLLPEFPAGGIDWNMVGEMIEAIPRSAASMSHIDMLEALLGWALLERCRIEITQKAAE